MQGERRRAGGVTLVLEEGNELVTKPKGRHMDNRIRRTTDKTKRTTSSGEIDQTIDISEKARVCFTFPEIEARSSLIDHTKKGSHIRDRVVGPRTVEDVRRTRNHAHRCVECRPREARRWRKAQAEPQHLDTGDRDQ